MKQKIVYAYVVADLLHVGHILHLQNAKSLGGPDCRVVVGVLTDEATMEKKPKPTLSFGERMRLVQSLKSVDIAVAQESYSPIPNIKRIKPDILLESTSHSEEDLKETMQVANSIGCQVIVMPYYPEQSSTKIKESVLYEWKKPENSQPKQEPNINQENRNDSD